MSKWNKSLLSLFFFFLKKQKKTNLASLVSAQLEQTGMMEMKHISIIIFRNHSNKVKKEIKKSTISELLGFF